MAGTPGMIGKGLKYAVKYGPQVAVAVKVAKEPAQEAARKAWAAQQARRSAFAQAETLADGSVLKVFHGGAPVWIVFSGEDVITWMPRPVGVAVDTLLDHADLSQRVRPEDRPKASDRMKKFAPRRRKAPFDEVPDPARPSTPQDALRDPQDVLSGPQDALGGPQDALDGPQDARGARAVWPDLT